MAGNICRCGTYVRIRAAIKQRRIRASVVGGRHDESDTIAATSSRRALLTGGLAGGFLLAFHLPLRAASTSRCSRPTRPPASSRPTPSSASIATGKTTLIMPQVEMGQGVYTAISMILAEELDADFARSMLEHAPPNDKLYGNPTFGMQVTGNSNSIRAFWKPLRKAGAGARAMLVQAAAQQWQVDPASCTAANGEVIACRQRAQACLWRARRRRRAAADAAEGRRR